MNILRLGLLLAVGLLSACSGDTITQLVQGDSGEPRLRDAGGCISDLECSDGLFCNGAELCLPNETDADADGCVPARSMPTCDDGIPCTSDRCSDLLNHCEFAAPDADADGHADQNCEDASGDALGDDCADDDDNRYPGNGEVCDFDAHDEDCDPTTFGNRDRDGDRAFDKLCCNGVGPTAVCGDDCDDQLLARRPLQVEVCDGLDNDCDDRLDEEMNSVPWYRDRDGDLFGGVEQQGELSCTPIVGASLLNTDCNDDRIVQHPAQIELCDFEDNNCDGVIDEPVYCGGSVIVPDGGISGSGGSGGISGSGGTGGTGGIGGSGGIGGTGGGCATGFANCETSNADCETPITTIDNCGACGVTCDGTHATVICASMMCQVDLNNGGCAPYYADCDQDGMTGCESVVATDALNCGRCDRDCGGATCVSGLCNATTLINITTSPAIPIHQYATLTPTRIFLLSHSNYTNGYEVRYGYRDLNATQLDGVPVTSSAGPITQFGGLATDGTNVYWGIEGTPSVVQQKPAGNDASGVSTAFTTVNGIRFSNLRHHNGSLYWTNNAATAGMVTIRSRSVSGAGSDAALISNRGSVSQLVVTATKLFWIENNTGSEYRLYMAPIGGGTLIQELAVVNATTTLDADATHVYWTIDGANNATDDRILRLPYNVQPLVSESVLAGVDNPSGTLLDADYVYFVAADVVRRVPKARDALSQPLSYINQIVKRAWAVDGQFLYVMLNVSGYDAVARVAK